MEGIEIFPNLKKLNIEANRIVNLIPLNRLRKLKELNLCNNNIKDISTLVYCKNLKRLNIEGNKIVDLSPLTKLRNLEKLNIYGNDFRQITELSECKKLKELYIYHPQIMDYKQLSNIPNLKTLYINQFETNRDDIEELQNYLPNCKIETILGYVF